MEILRKLKHTPNQKLNRMKPNRFLWGLMLCLGIWAGVFGCGLISNASFKEVKSISKESLKSRIGDPSIVILDVRRPQDWKRSGIKIKGALLENPYKFNAWYSRYPKTKTIILYCA
jgi:Rhodanese-like domain